LRVEDRLAEYLLKKPQISSSAFVVNNATVVGDVTIKDDASVWYQAVLRGDINCITIGKCSNIQDGVIGHLSDDYPLVVGDYVTVGHGAVLHACTIEDECLIGMNSTILDGARIGKHSIIAAGAVVPMNASIPEGSLVAGIPGKVKKTLPDHERLKIKGWAEKYLVVKDAHRDFPS
jgi:carbonic anhydrase/acetyltransferase-like protein (isoleucine patch superfamily)